MLHNCCTEGSQLLLLCCRTQESTSQKRPHKVPILNSYGTNRISASCVCAGTTL